MIFVRIIAGSTLKVRLIGTPKEIGTAAMTIFKNAQR
jgi:hypothetical protein